MNQDSHVIIAWVLLPLIAFHPYVTGETYYCEDKQETVIDDDSGTIRTIEEGSTYYDNNLDCSWVISTDDPDKRIQLTVEKSDLQWAPDNAICNGYDYIEVRDGSKSGPVILSWCGDMNPRSLISNTSNLYIRFKTNDRTIYEYTGATLKFDVFTMGESGGCPEGWERGPTPNGDYCYVLKNHAETWKEGQDYCMNDQSNLVSFLTDEEADFVAEYVKTTLSPNSKEYVWIGLNDIEVDTQYKWIDHISSTVTMRWRDDPHVSNEYLNCVTLKSNDGLWQEKDCAESDIQSLVKYKFICKRKTDQPTKLYLVPNERIEKGKEGTLPAKALIIIGVVILCAIVGGGLFALYYRKYKQKKATKPSRQAQAEADHGVASPEAVELTPPHREASGSQPSAPLRDSDEYVPPYPVAPPTYDEAMTHPQPKGHYANV